ncbi:hypothetical protein GOBAR_AA33629 [Gossypium barbadense]|uniref:Protein kinase domain-containing protein n=1 Tax=Gossypium barbadense TaxID=3634 RepID=A0A2P5W7I6_GOSBA|nr:hypothetical protein GOBAR_AA33629 [Gossypium barbadense]
MSQLHLSLAMAAGFYLFISLPLILSCLFFAFPSVYSVNFEISRFEHSDDLILFQGEARPTNGIIDFNTVDNLYRVGWVPMWDPKTGKLSDFSTRFAFSIDTQDASDYGHGFVFFFAPAGSQLPLNLAAGRLGLFNTSQWVSRLGQVVMVKFDTYKNGWDPAHLDNHVGITNNSIMLVKTRKMRKPEVVENLTSINDALEKGTGPRRFIWFGAVYRGYLPDLDVVVAVKRISRGSKQGKKEYITEVKIISQLRHRNLVQLIGWCHDEGEFLLVYEFMPNGSLDFHLFGNKTPLSWVVRYRISLGLASAILYRHEEWEQYVVHRDIKSNNIMLDSSFNVKLGDFGLARLMDHELGPKTTSLAGTLGYLASEYVNLGRAMVLLEIATGRKSVHRIQDFEMGLVVWVWDLYGQEKLLSAVDEKLNNNVDEKQVDRLMIVGLWCAHPDNSSRPSIKQGTQALNFEIEKPNIPTKMPIATTSDKPILTNTSLEVGR